MNAKVAAVFFSLVLGISVDWIQASSTFTTTGSIPSSSSTTASPQASSAGNTLLVLPTPSSPAKAQVPVGRVSVNFTDLSTTTLASSPSTTTGSSPSSSSTTASPKGSSTENTISVFPMPSSPAKAQVPVVPGSVNSTDLSTTTLASSPSTTTGSGPSSSSTTVLPKASSTENTPLVLPTPSSTSRAQVPAGSGSVNSTDLSTTTSPSSSSIVAETSTYSFYKERLSSYLASTPATHTTSSRPTIPPGGTKMVNMEVTLNMKFRKEYNDVNSPIYTELVANLTRALIRVYKEVDGFVDVRVLFIRRGSIVCNYIVILASNSEVTDDDLKEKLHKGSNDDKFPFEVKGIAVIEDSDAVAAKTKLPQWAMTTMIVLGALAFCFLVIAICACIKYRNAVSSENYIIYDMPPGKLDMRAYDAISMGHMRANVDDNTSTGQRRLVLSHENPTYGS
ncbi:PREDICTED: cell wall protein DAN4-like isoform X7 [Acropora digitifera]|uniref:cell wall protein DAN4-like isoform X7 n=1 Tax=Acropora digitifera TaxID=70779 RepID=UPI00077AC1AC|nr:PREDICTED: cell wall protein DAN4-like isoform X7 [Acropora digitifera]